MPKVVFVNEKQEVEVAVGANLRLAARAAGIQVYPGLPERLFNCRGLGACGTCKVLVKQGMDHLSPPTPMERLNLRLHPLTVLARIGHEEELRLACQVSVLGDCTVETRPAFNWVGENFWQKPYPNK